VIALKGSTRPGRSVLAHERQQAARRLSTLLADMDGLDAAPSETLLELKNEVSAVLARIASLDQQLAECSTAPLADLVEAQQQRLITPRQKRQAARGRLQAVLLVLDGLPDSCTSAARLLRKAVRTELKRIEQSRREEFPCS
jgi:hypothetical protein